MSNLYKITQTIYYYVEAEDTDDAFDKFDSMDKADASKVYNEIDLVELNYINTKENYE